MIVNFQIVKMFALVVLIFILCWAPYHIYFIYSYHNPSITRKEYIMHIYLFFYWLAMCNTCVNPIIYYWMNRRFRDYFNIILCCISRTIRKCDISGKEPVLQISNKLRLLSVSEKTIQTAVEVIETDHDDCSKNNQNMETQTRKTETSLSIQKSSKEVLADTCLEEVLF